VFEEVPVKLAAVRPVTRFPAESVALISIAADCVAPFVV
jgi:hypothetical protein